MAKNMALSFREQNGSFDNQLDKITTKELNTLLNEKINNAYAHQFDEVKHVTAEERTRWNNIVNTFNPATQSTDGLFSAQDKVKLDGIATGANKYVHPQTGVVTGTYTRVSVNPEGHVIYADNPNRLDITAANAEKLGGAFPSEYARLASPTFTGVVKMPDVTMTSNASSPVTIKLLQSYVSEQLNRSWPIGSIFITVSNINPANSIGGKWKRIAEGRCLVGVGASQNVDIKLRQTGGAWETQLSEAQLPSHSHPFNYSGTTDTTSLVGGFGFDVWGRDGWGIVHNNGGAKRQGVGTDNRSPGGDKTIDATHNHTFKINGRTEYVGGGNAVNLAQPFIGVYMWERIE